MKKMWKGNHAIAEAALRGGCEFYAGYPITPQTEVMEYLSYRMPEIGKAFIQSENEMSAMYMIFGAYACGMRSMTSSSGPGISLKQEGISYLCANNFPSVIINVQRWGTGLGSLDSAQTDYLRDTRGGGNGDYRAVVFTPSTIQEMVDFLANDAFEIAEKYRVPVEVLTEAALGQMMEPVAFPDFKYRTTDLGWTFDGTDRPHGRMDTDAKVPYQREKVAKMVANEQRWESIEVKDADYVFFAIGIPARTCMNAVKKLRAEGKKVGLIRPIMVWPFPEKAYAELKKDVKGLISVEQSDCGQLVEDVALFAKKAGFGSTPIYANLAGNHIPTTQSIVDHFNKIVAGEIKEVF